MDFVDLNASLKGVFGGRCTEFATSWNSLGTSLSAKGMHWPHYCHCGCMLCGVSSCILMSCDRCCTLSRIWGRHHMKPWRTQCYVSCRFDTTSLNISWWNYTFLSFFHCAWLDVWTVLCYWALRSFNGDTCVFYVSQSASVAEEGLCKDVWQKWLAEMPSRDSRPRNAIQKLLQKMRWITFWRNWFQRVEQLTTSSFLSFF